MHGPAWPPSSCTCRWRCRAAVGHFLRYAVAWLIPLTRQSLEWDAREALGGRRLSYRRLLAAYGTLLAASLLVALAGALLPI